MRPSEADPLLGAEARRPRFTLAIVSGVAVVAVIALSATYATAVHSKQQSAALGDDAWEVAAMGDGLISSPQDLAGREFIDTVVHMRYWSRLDPHRQAGLGAGDTGMLTKLPRVYSFFDWVLHTKQTWPWDELDIKKNDDPKNVLVLPNHQDLMTVHDRALGLPSLGFGQCRHLVIAGEDTRLSNVSSLVQNIIDTKKFSKIYFEAKDVEMEGVHTIAMGFNSFYLLHNGIQNVMNAINRAQTTPKDKLLAAAWGAMWSDAILSKQGDNERYDADQFVQSAGKWIQRTNWDAKDYWSKLSHYHFMIAPAGAGIQAPKLAEAWAVRTIPVTTRYPAFHDLYSQGFPIVLVDKWSDITPELLASYLESKEHASINWVSVQSRLNPLQWKANYMCAED